MNELASGAIEVSLGKRAALAGLGFVIAAFAAMCGIGGGLFVVPLLHYGFGFSLQRAIATGLGLVAATTGAGTIAEVLHAESAIDWPAVGFMLVGGLTGAQLGFEVAKRMSTVRLKLLFVIVLLIAAGRMFAGGDLGPPGAEQIENFGALEYAGFALVGLVAGFVSPLLGIGGGLVSVPALFLGFPALGYLGARACSMALGAITSLRSLWLYHRAGRVNLAVALWLGGGALVGAVAGVQLVHLDGADKIGQYFLASLLVVVAIRFALDVHRSQANED